MPGTAWKPKTEAAEKASRPPEPPLGSSGLPKGPISEICIEGNSSIPVEKIRSKLLSKAGEHFDLRKIDADVKTLMKTTWFSFVEAFHDESPPRSGKYTLIYVLHEIPVLTHVEFRGREAVRLEELEARTGLKKGARADYMRHSQRGAYDPPALPGEGLRAGRGRADRGGQSG